MGKYLSFFKGNYRITRLIFAMLVFMAAIASSASRPLSVHAGMSQDPLAGKRYFADIGDDYYLFDAVKYCNDRHMFGTKKGKQFYLNPKEHISKGEAIRLIYNMYHKKLDWGEKSYNEKYKESWQWAQSLGIVGKKEKPDQTAMCDWAYAMVNKLTYAINGGSVYWLYGAPHIEAVRMDVVGVIWQIGAECGYGNTAWDPRNM